MPERSSPALPDFAALAFLPALVDLAAFAAFVPAACLLSALPLPLPCGVAAEAAERGLPFLGEVPLDLSVRLAGDSGQPVALGEGPVAGAYARLADRLIRGDMA